VTGPTERSAGPTAAADDAPETPDAIGHRGLEGYLNDHLAGSAAGVRLAQRCHDRDPESELGRHLADLLGEIQLDRRVLKQVMSALGATPDRVKEVAALGAELLASVKNRLPGLGVGSDAVARLEEIELLSLGIEGNRLLWVALGTLAIADGRLKEFDFDELERRAQKQRDGLERFRLELASNAHGPSAD
jgi:hypothetical protein